MSKAFFIYTFGCQMNEYDSELISGLMARDGYVQAATAESADVVFVNTCSVRELASEKAYSCIGRLIKKGRKKGRVVVMCGCAAEKDGVAAQKRMHGIDLVVGPSKIREIPSLVASFFKKKLPVCSTGDSKIDWSADGFIKRSSGEKAWVTVSKGCNSFCSYCIVPYVRGREESRPAEDILRSVSRLVSLGYTEINLLGQNVNTYGMDKKGLPDFPELLSELDSIPGEFRISFKTSHPKDFGEKLAGAVARSRKVYRSFHLPVQSGSDRILKLMNRKYDRERYLEAVHLVRAIPKASLTTDIIVGFPGETDRDFEDTVSLFEAACFDSAYIFKYSQRKGTKASDLGDSIPKAVKEKRLAQLMDLQKKTGLSRNSLLVGGAYEILIDSGSQNGDLVFGKTFSEKQVFVRAKKGLKGFVKAKIISAAPFSLKGEVCK